MAKLLSLVENSVTESNEISVSAIVRTRRRDLMAFHPALIPSYETLVADATSAAAQMIYVSNFKIATLQFFLTLELDGGRIVGKSPGITSSSLAPYIPTLSIRPRGGLLLSLKGIEDNAVFLTSEAFGRKLVTHYAFQGIGNLHRILADVNFGLNPLPLAKT